MKKPNIILINCDDLGYGDLGCYGSKLNQTPHIDQLATDGIRFNDFYMVSPVCSPSRCGMMTGCYAERVGCGFFSRGHVLYPGDTDGLHPQEKTMARHLKECGYATALIGKWHCGDQPEFLPTRHGFDQYYGIPYSNDMGMMAIRPSARKVPLPLMHDSEVMEEQPDQTGLTERYVEKAVRFFRDNRERPFFLYFAHMHVHLPLLVSQRFLDASNNGPYGGAVECIDWATGAMVAELKRLGLYENTLIVFTSDNGSKGINGGSNEPLRGGKATTWEGGMRVPGIVSWPAAIHGGQVRDDIFTAIDLLPTFVRLAGGEYDPAHIDGLDFSAVLTDPDVEGPRETLLYYRANYLCALRHGKWKFHRARLERRDGKSELIETCELYDLARDVGESTNLAEQCPEHVHAMQGMMDQAAGQYGDRRTGVAGTLCRPVGKVDNPVPLTTYDPQHPYMIAMYDGKIG